MSWKTRLFRNGETLRRKWSASSPASFRLAPRKGVVAMTTDANQINMILTIKIHSIFDINSIFIVVIYSFSQLLWLPAAHVFLYM